MKRFLVAAGISHRHQLLVCLLAVPLLALAGESAAQAYPSRTVRLVVPFPPGGTTDGVARIIAQKMTESMGRPVVVENRSGAGGNVGTEAVAKSAPDGYTMALIANSFTTAPLLSKDVPFNAVTDFAPVALVASAPSVLVTAANAPFRTVADVVQYARANPGKLSYASAGKATLGHLSAELFKAETRTDILHVAYKGGGPAITDVIGGQVNLLFDVLTTAVPQVKAGRMRPLATTGAKRSPLLPDTPTMIESGFPAFQTTAWFGLVVPAATPKEIVGRLNAEVNAALGTSDVRERLAALSTEVEGGTIDQFVAFMRADAAKWARVIKEAGIRAD